MSGVVHEYTPPPPPPTPLTLPIPSAACGSDETEVGVLFQRDRVLLLQQPAVAPAGAPHRVPLYGLEGILGLGLREASRRRAWRTVGTFRGVAARLRLVFLSRRVQCISTPLRVVLVRCVLRSCVFCYRGCLFRRLFVYHTF